MKKSIPLLRPLFLAVALLGLNVVPVGHAQSFTVIKSFGVVTDVLTNVTGHTPRAPLVQGVDGTLYGTTSSGEGIAGTIFKIQPDGSGFRVLKWFTNTVEGASPQGGLVVFGSMLFGTTCTGGSSGNGTVFKVNTDGSGYALLKNFGGSDGATPRAGLVLSGSTLYGTTSSGGNSTNGTVFKVHTNGSAYTVLKNLAGSDGADPWGDLILSGSTLYGTTYGGGSSNKGTVFKVNTDGSAYAILKNFAGSDGANPYAGLVLSGSTLYGTTCSGGSSNNGTVFKVNTDGSAYTLLKHFAGYPDGASPHGGLVLSGSTLYGTTYNDGSSHYGTVFQVNTDGSAYTVLKNFANSDGAGPYAGLILSGSMLYGTTCDCVNSICGKLFKFNINNGAYTVLKDFAQNASDGANPYAGLVLSGSTLYGTTYGGGSSDFGTVFKVNTDGSGYTVLMNFTPYYGGWPYAGLVLSGSTLYGTASSFGGSGTVFKIKTDGSAYTMLKKFSGSPDGGHPYAGLVLSGSALYGTTWIGGSSNYGVVFKVNTNATGYTNLYSFSAPDPTYSTNTDGAWPFAGLVLSGSTLYGTTWKGGSSGKGTVFKVNTDGTGFTNLYSFSAWDPTDHTTNSDGAYPYAGLVLSASTLYGTTEYGGFYGCGTVFKINTDGSGFSVLKHFAGSDGAYPFAGLILSGSTLYGTTHDGGSSGKGTVFQVNTDGSGYLVLKNFTVSDGAGPCAGLILSGSTLYGTTYSGGGFGYGTIFALDLSVIPPLSIQTADGAFGFSNQQFCFTVTGSAFSNAIISASTNLQDWTPLVTNSLFGGMLPFTDVLATNFLQRFYRAQLAP